ncbi:MAG TPA: TlpA disulfide reductase family protein [Rhodanobacteraceae bacterium]|nr:TlpA disulfide reductase family protein [Rhodanobacteraceae bacterium]
MIDRRATVVILVLAGAAAAGGWWLQRSLQAPPAPPASLVATPAKTSILKVGDRADDLVLPDLGGKPQSLAQWHGRRVLLNFWATWCAPCRKEMPELAAAQTRYQGVQVVGVALDQPQAVREYLKHTTVDYPILIGIDADPEPTLHFGDTVGALPYSVLIGPDGRIQRTKLGPFDAAELDDWLGSKS